MMMTIMTQTGAVLREGLGDRGCPPVSPNEVDHGDILTEIPVYDIASLGQAVCHAVPPIC